jgi:ATP-dependent helicase Lhr and Lhr-like helicase
LLVAPDTADRTVSLARRAYHHTAAAAVLAAALQACPDAQDGDLIVDVIPGPGTGGTATVWLSETSIGGLGVIEHLLRYYANDPRRFWALVADAQQPSDYEHSDVTLSRLLRHVVDEEPHGAVAAAMAELRGAPSAADGDRALSKLLDAWAQFDGFPRHSAVAALATRVMRPGSSAGTDAVSLGLIDGWAALEQQLGFEVDARVIAYAVGSDQMPTRDGRALSADQAFSMLWPRGSQARNHHLQHYQPYADPASPVTLDRLLLDAAHDERLPQIPVDEPGWEQRYQQEIAAAGAVELICPATDRQSLSAALAQVPALPVDRDVLRIFGNLTGVSRYGPLFSAHIELLEAMQ